MGKRGKKKEETDGDFLPFFCSPSLSQPVDVALLCPQTVTESVLTAPNIYNQNSPELYSLSFHSSPSTFLKKKN